MIADFSAAAASRTCGVDKGIAEDWVEIGSSTGEPGVSSTMEGKGGKKCGIYSGGSQFGSRGRFRLGEDGLEMGDKGNGGVDGRDGVRFRGRALIRLGDVSSTSMSCCSSTNCGESYILTSSSEPLPSSSAKSISSKRGVGQRAYSSKMASSLSCLSPSARWAEKEMRGE